MNFFSSSQQSYDGDVDAIFDIRSGSVGVSLVTADDETPKVHWSDRFAVDFLSEHDTDRLLHMTKDALTKAVSALQKDGLKAVKKTSKSASVGKVFCYFSAPWQIGSPQEVEIEKESRFIVNENRLELAQEQAEKLFQEKALKHYDTKEDNLVPLTTALLGCWCNGYRLEKPHGVRTNKLLASTYISIIPQRLRDTIEETISQSFHPDKISYHSFTVAIHRAFTERFSHPKTFLVINVDEEMTQLLIVNSGVLMGLVSYPTGSHFLIRQLSKSLDVPIADAKTRLHQFQEKEAGSIRDNEVKQILNKTREKWQELLRDALGKFSADISIPEYAFVLANHDTSAAFREFTKGMDVSDHILRTDSFRVHEVTDDLLQIHLSTQEDHSDHYLSIASVIHADTQTDIVGS
jgi:translation elongation factor EF-Ts